MYLVTVFYAIGCIEVDSAEFKFGSWHEIGFWLDNYGYNDPQYRLEIKFRTA